MHAVAWNDGRNVEALLRQVLADQAATRAEMRAGFQELRGEIHEIRGEIQEIRGEIQDLREEMQRLRFVTGAAIRDHGRRLGALERNRQTDRSMARAVFRRLASIERLVRARNGR